MAQLATKIIDQAPAAIDRAHLARTTFGDRALEREVLQLFDLQAELLLARMRSGNPQALAALAHTLRGSASGIGDAAWENRPGRRDRGCQTHY